MDRLLSRAPATILCAFLLSVGIAARAQSLRPGILGTDDRVRIEPEGPPWEAVGQVNIGGYRLGGACTGTLVAPDMVLTAAHCLMDPWKRRPHPLHNIHFLVGVSGERNKGHATAKCLRFPAGYDYVPPPKILPAMPAQRVPWQSFLRDVAVIILNTPLSVAPAQLAEDVAAVPGLELAHAAYPGDRRHALSLHAGCHLLIAGGDDQPWLTDCDTHPGSSGGPVFSIGPQGPRLAAVMVGISEGQGSIAAPIAAWRALLRDAACPAPGGAAN